MASTDQRTGFRLPWTSAPADTESHPDAGDEAEPQEAQATNEAVSDEAQPAATGTADAQATDAAADQPTDAAADQPTAGSAEEGAHAEAVATPEVTPEVTPDATPEATLEGAPHVTQPTSSQPASSPADRRQPPARFMAELVRAMRAAADDSSKATLDQFRADAKTYIEGIHARSSEEVTELRRLADEDVAGIREWSKAEIARIRAETEDRITGRKEQLEAHLEEHAALIEREIEKVQARIGAFEHEMEDFFASLVEIDDPTVFAARAQNLPEPPSLETTGAEARAEALSDLVRGVREAAAAEPEPEPTSSAEDAPEAAVATADPEAPEATLEAVEQTAASTEQTAAAPEETAAATWTEPGTEALDAPAETAADAGPEATAEPALEATGQEATEVTDHAWPTTDVAPADSQGADAQQASSEPVADGVAADAATPDAIPVEASGIDPRLAAFGLSPDLAMAESEAHAEAAEEGVTELNEDAVAARLAGLIPTEPVSHAAPAPEPGDTVTTQVVVVGLVSVSSIASFKRQLGRLPGVHSVGVSSGPDGEFVFKASHEPSVALKDIVPTLPGFAARVTSAGDGIIHVTAHDPDSAD